MAYPTTLDSFTTKVDNTDTILAAHVNGLQAAVVATETELMVTTDRAKFLAYSSGTDADVTGDGTVWDAQFDTEVFDTGADFASHVFTAPVAGKYLLQAQVTFVELGAAHTNGLIQIVTSNHTYVSGSSNLYAFSVGGYNSVRMMVVADMDAGDTAKVQAQVSGGTKVVDVYGGAVYRTFFSGALIL